MYIVSLFAVIFSIFYLGMYLKIHWNRISKWDNYDVPSEIIHVYFFQTCMYTCRFTYVALLMHFLSVTAPEDDLCIGSKRRVNKDEVTYNCACCAFLHVHVSKVYSKVTIFVRVSFSNYNFGEPL